MWTTLEALEGHREWKLDELEADLYALTVTPTVGIGQRGLLVRTDAGNLLWEPPGFMDDALVRALEELGGVAAIAASHPHLTGVSISLSHALGNSPVYRGADDQRWICRPDDVIQLWRDRLDVLPGLTLHQCGGHFPGSAVLHWTVGAAGRGVLMSGDTFLVGADRKTVGFMRSYPNLIPLSPRSVRKIADTVAPLEFDRLYSGFAPGSIETDASNAVQASARRYIGWMTDNIRDPDERA